MTAIQGRPGDTSTSRQDEWAWLVQVAVTLTQAITGGPRLPHAVRPLLPNHGKLKVNAHAAIPVDRADSAQNRLFGAADHGDLTILY